MSKKEFRLADEYQYNRSGAVRWIISHLLRYPWLPVAALVAAIINNVAYSYIQIFIGRAFDLITQPAWETQALLLLAAGVLVSATSQGLLGLARNASTEFVAQRIERDSRDELYVSLLGKSQTFHGRQRIGDIMARATNDVRALNIMFSPGLMLVLDSAMGIVVPVWLIGAMRLELLLVPAIFLVFWAITVADYTRRLNPVSIAQREQFGLMNAGLAEAIAGIEVVKGNVQEKQEVASFVENARRFRNYFVKQGEIQARYLPLLVFSAAQALAFLHGLWLWRAGTLTLGEVVAFMGLFGVFRFPTFISIFSFNLVQLGVASAERILALINTETDLDENEAGEARPVKGRVVFDNVTFSYDGAPVLKQISFTAEPGQTVAIVGQTGAGKTTLTRLINRIFDANSGRVLVDGVDVRDWKLESLRSQISSIEQDVFLFSRTIAENIAFGLPEASQAEIERAAGEAQAHDFITGFSEGYQTEVGERGVTLSGGQRQRIAIARAFLTDPRILILDDSTSAIDSATEDQIQQAMRRISRQRTTFLITHRLSQIRWADRILVLKQGELVDQGTHEELLARSEDYQRIFARYD
ncbi:MAG: ABC transporter ATP-binding protein/permease [Chloroflexi bacterium]|nr:ABC transporter ATP-binding protein/permease [Chloroflexota bacterium]MCI0580833.1 ABC transporter ATP-binding protein/permease [Chloroflexota bacterium]MCI0648173.1 ABC transporter ATP-binding protein/permease [Chloroflexota bacterium]MCI0730315.1 ABC transporter ATP-binding protein/permease [Chloroflexota bacterium]